MTRLIIIGAAVLSLIGTLILGALWRDVTMAPAPPPAEVRLTDEAMAELVRTPLGQAQAGDLTGGQRTFERSVRIAGIRHGANSLEVGDLLMSFGVLLQQQESESLPEKDALAAGYLRRAIAAYRVALGPNHPEVATALNSYADVLTFAHPDDPPAEAERALAEAYRIRLASRGPHHPETLWTRLYLADIHGLPSRTRGEPARIAAVLAELDRVVELSRRGDPPTAAQIPVTAELRRAQILARHGQGDQAMRAFSVAERRARASRDAEACMMPFMSGERLADLLEDQGDSERAQRVRARTGIDTIPRCND